MWRTLIQKTSAYTLDQVENVNSKNKCLYLSQRLVESPVIAQHMNHSIPIINYASTLVIC